MPLAVRYHFSQSFVVSARKAFTWCTDFDPKDHALMGDANIERHISRVAKGSLILRDTFHLPAETVEKQKLVQLYPEQLSWISTHFTGPNKYSQFLYKIIPRGKDASDLNFVASHLEYDEKADAKLLADLLCKEDAFAWNLLAKAMAKELKKRD